MKIRHDFVSNSSSSSFIFILKKEDVENLDSVIQVVTELIGAEVAYDEYSKATARDVAEDILHACKKEVEQIDMFDDGIITPVLFKKTVKEMSESTYHQDKIDDPEETDKEYYRDGEKGRIEWVATWGKWVDKIEDAHIAVKVEYGDHHGNTGPVGTAMDYSFSDREIIKDGRAVIVESSH